MSCDCMKEVYETGTARGIDRNKRNIFAEQIAESVDALTAELLMDTECAREDVRDHVVCKRLRAAIDAAIEEHERAR